ncbi:Protein of unknown function [Actinopolyspora xinjiangensis]|uniref:DUF742 domain-containing protein n=1 Tax=Actinopolyspora xinjiangensis TaxID=405564 RepID=A0A1H0WBS8_9ACTN|nr:DUF742 domain-containing protein [Actinopolyspora xinjiangensis]SDP88249.1 Protein of unknown function [Actinopolyspora xinjiangensis]
MSRDSGYNERRSGEVGRWYGRDEEQDVDEATFADVYNALNFGSGRGRSKRKSEEPREPRSRSTERSRSEGAHTAESASRESEPADRTEQGEDAPAASIRSYAWTGGRTKSNVELELETLISTSAQYRPGTPLRQEYHSVVQLCGQPRSVAEIGALLGVPFGVAKVLLADMAEQGLVDIHQTVTDSGSEPHMMLMERVLSGLRRL